MNQVVTLKKPVPRELLAEVEDKLRFGAEGLQGFRIDPSRPDRLELQIAPEVDAQEVVRKVTQLIEGMTAGWRPVAPRIRYDQRHICPRYTGNAWQELLERGWAQPLAPGQISITGPALALLEYFDRRFVALAEELSAQEVRYPQMIAVEALERCQYFSSFPHHVTFCSHLKEDLDVLTGFAKARHLEANYPFEQGLRPPGYVLNPAICFHAYHSVSGQHLSGPQVLTTAGRCFRYESTAMTSLERLWDFTMREIIFLGPATWVRAQRERTLEALIGLVQELELQAWIESASDAFFVTNFVAKKYHQLLTDAKLELRLTLPFVEGAVAVASFNYHEDFFGRAYDVRVDEGPLHTGCTAFGLERWVYAFLCQYGLDQTVWPASVRNGCGYSGA